MFATVCTECPVTTQLDFEVRFGHTCVNDIQIIVDPSGVFATNHIDIITYSNSGAIVKWRQSTGNG